MKNKKQDCELLEPQTVWTDTVVWLHHLTSHLIMTWPHSFPPTDQKPTMLQLMELQGKSRQINIVKGIGVNWMMVGTKLLADEDYTTVPAIAEQYGDNAERINMEILGRWVRGEGIPDCSWRGLLGVLRVHCGALANRVEEALMAEEAEQGKCTVANSLKQGCGSSQNGIEWAEFLCEQLRSMARQGTFSRLDLVVPK